MSAKIRVLSEHTINKIAAGEVIENPASVVKELIENALDAGATRIDIAIKGGGQQLIQISDDGCGMGGDDALLCFERHATSKIKEAEDLFQLATMGFRGEALASIAAISKTTLITSLGQEGVRVEVEAGRILRIEPYARTRGTTVEVRALFYNVPARKKFQKSATVNAAEITRVVATLSLAYPEISFHLSQQDRAAFAAEAGRSFEEGLKARALQVVGEGKLFDLRSAVAKGVLGAPELGRRNRSGQYLFVNRRFVFCPAVSYAVKDAYATRLETDRYPLFVIHLNLDPELIDVNVHPQKKEIRLRDEASVKQMVREAVRQSLDGGPTIAPSFSPPVTFDFSFREQPTPIFQLQEETTPFHHQAAFINEPAKAIGLFDHYLLLEAASLAGRLEKQSDGVLMVDLYRAQARVAFEAMLKEEEGKIARQGLLLPITLEFSSLEAEQLSLRLEEIEKIGVVIRPIGDTAFLIDALPPAIEAEDVQLMLLEMLEVAAERSNIAKVAARFAGARKKSFVLQEALALLEELLACSAPFRCPEGKTTMAQINSYEIARYF